MIETTANKYTWQSRSLLPCVIIGAMLATTGQCDEAM
ncbi:hypothetical protein Mal15_18750 [Stieleria maiorica]|uniref:Uncharacterized protein n=1 Tax=Stieleria maiorica TaxID=2795974 RepID=A0A5B9MD09_9BACT|nr:hypothetical protein Mal15_18750 [Stieleria maiorica]